MRSLRHFVFDGVSSRNFETYISGEFTYKRPKRRVNKIIVPGSNGDLVMDEGTYDNVTITIPCFIRDNIKDNGEGIANKLLTTSGYCRYEDTYHPEIYRMAMYVGPWDPDVFCNRSGTFKLDFDMKPERWLKSGEHEITVTDGSTLMNPELTIAKPKIRLYGTGTLQIGSRSLTVNTAGDSYIEYDSITENAMEGNYDRNENVELTDHLPLILEPGENGISIDGLSQVVIIPRWWKL